MIETVSADESTRNLPKRQVKKELGKDDFLLLLTKQLQSQDPMKPLENTEFIAQMAQFSALEQTANLNENFKSFMAGQGDFYRIQMLGLVGLEVEGVKQPDSEGGSPLNVKGIVESVSMVGGRALLKVGEHLLTIEELTTVGTPSGSLKDEPIAKSGVN